MIIFSCVFSIHQQLLFGFLRKYIGCELGVIFVLQYIGDILNLLQYFQSGCQLFFLYFIDFRIVFLCRKSFDELDTHYLEYVRCNIDLDT